MVIEIHDMNEDEFVEKILKGHVGYPSVEDIGYKYITDTLVALNVMYLIGY